MPSSPVFDVDVDVLTVTCGDVTAVRDLTFHVQPRVLRPWARRSGQDLRHGLRLRKEPAGRSGGLPEVPTTVPWLTPSTPAWFTSRSPWAPPDPALILSTAHHSTALTDEHLLESP